MNLTWIKKLLIRQLLNIMTRLLAPTIALVLCIASVASQAPKFQKGGIKFSPPCGLKSGVGTWTALGTLKGDIADYVFHLEVYIWDLYIGKRVGSSCFLDLTVCTSNPPDATQDLICYCTGTTGTGSSAEYSLNITAIAKASHSEFEVKAELKPKNTQVLSVEEFDIAELPVMYEEVVPTIEIDDGGKQLLTPVTDITFVTSSPTIKVEFCAKHMQPGGEICIKSGIFVEQECTADEWASTTSTLHFRYRQPDFTLPCDTGKSFTIKLTVLPPFTGSTTEKHGSATEKHGSATEKHGSATEKHGSVTEKHGSATEKHGSATQKHGSATEKLGSATEKHGSTMNMNMNMNVNTNGSTTEKQSNGCQQVKMNKLWIAALATYFLFLA